VRRQRNKNPGLSTGHETHTFVFSLRFSMDHVAGTEGDYETAQYTLQQFQAMGLSAEIQPLQVLLNYPISRSLEVTAPIQYQAGLSEDIFPNDPTSGNRWRNFTFHGYGASGDVSGEVVYVNYGSYDDFKSLQDKGVDFTGKIVLARYG
jgi:N-acetylated-alpha-linked acidic dipeptidase